MVFFIRIKTCLIRMEWMKNLKAIFIDNMNNLGLV